MHSTMRADPGREVGQPSAPTRQVAEIAFNLPALTQQIAPEVRLWILQDFFRPQATRALFAMAVSATGPVTSRRH